MKGIDPMMNKKVELLLKFATIAPPGPFFEIGCIRKEGDETDGQSTLHLAMYCKKNNKSFLSVDCDPNSVKVANNILKNNSLSFRVIEGDGEKILLDLDRNVSFLFLDSHKNPSFSFNQYKAARLSKGAVLIIDDAQQIEGWEFGKADFIKKVFDKKKRPYDIAETVPGWKSFVTVLPNGKNPGEL